jgi:hypothetical protein
MLSGICAKFKNSFLQYFFHSDTVLKFKVLENFRASSKDK